ncbi:MAG TPA: glycosyltransferase family 39 protein, partial [Vicinamibacterales bacterium]
MAAPLLATPDVKLDTTAIDSASPVVTAFNGPFDLGHRFMYADNDGDRLLYRARFVNVLVGVLLGLLIFAWAAEWLGLSAAAVALTLYLLEPNIGAHATLVTNDVAVSGCFFGAVYLLWRASRRLKGPNVSGVVVCFVLGVLSKFSGLFLAPVLIVLACLEVRAGRALSMRGIATTAAIIIVALWAAVWLAYGLRFTPSNTPDWLFRLHDDPVVRQAAPMSAAVGAWIDGHRLLPNAFTEGFLHAQTLAQQRPAFLGGSYSSTGWWYYFPVAFALKTPVALLALLTVGILGCVRRSVPLVGGSLAFVVIPPLIFAAIAMTSALNIGVRHILPVYPFAIMLAALGAEWLRRGLRTRGPIVVGCILAAGVAEYALAYPNTLAFFNTLAGGGRNGFRYLADSNVDWGQDLKPLKKWMDANGVEHINLAYFGTAEPKYYGIDCTHIWGTTIPGVTPSMMRPPRLPGYVAISVTLLDGVPFQADQRDFYKRLRDQEPVADIGHSIRIYRVERPWWSPR